jgi:hypothetical protein
MSKQNENTWDVNPELPAAGWEFPNQYPPRETPTMATTMSGVATAIGRMLY